jgi:hypothetical protein
VSPLKLPSLKIDSIKASVRKKLFNDKESLDEIKPPVQRATPKKIATNIPTLPRSKVTVALATDRPYVAEAKKKKLPPQVLLKGQKNPSQILV